MKNAQQTHKTHQLQENTQQNTTKCKTNNNNTQHKQAANIIK